MVGNNDEEQQARFTWHQYQNKIRREAARLRPQLFEEVGNQCYICGLDYPSILTAHHIVPIHLRGSSHIENLIIVCRNCHELVHRAYDISEAVMNNPSNDMFVTNHQVLREWLEGHFLVEQLERLDKLVDLRRNPRVPEKLIDAASFPARSFVRQHGYYRNCWPSDPRHFRRKDF